MTYTVYLQALNANGSLSVVSGEQRRISLTAFSLPSKVRNAAAVAGDRQIAVSWSAPTVVDGTDHAANAARITFTEQLGSFTKTVDASGGSYTETGLTNGKDYTVSIKSKAVNPLGGEVLGLASETIADVHPFGLPLAPSGFHVEDPTIPSRLAGRKRSAQFPMATPSTLPAQL